MLLDCPRLLVYRVIRYFQPLQESRLPQGILKLQLFQELLLVPQLLEDLEVLPLLDYRQNQLHPLNHQVPEHLFDLVHLKHLLVPEHHYYLVFQ